MHLIQLGARLRYFPLPNVLIGLTQITAYESALVCCSRWLTDCHDSSKMGAGAGQRNDANKFEVKYNQSWA